MKRLWAWLILACLAVPCAAQRDIEGKWSCNSEDVKHTKLQWTLTITRMPTHLAATMAGGRDNDQFDLERVEFEGDIFRAMITINPPDDTVSMFLLLNGDTLNGGFDGKNSGDGPFLCHR